MLKKEECTEDELLRFAKHFKEVQENLPAIQSSFKFLFLILDDDETRMLDIRDALLYTQNNL